MLNKVYFLVWVLTTLAAIVFLVSGNFTEMAAVVFGFIYFGLVFMGMIAVLPNSVHDALTRH